MALESNRSTLPTFIAGDRIIHALAEIFDARPEKRDAPRRSYFGAVTVIPAAPGVELSAFARDISPLGIGLVHTQPIESGEVVVTLDLPSGGTVKLRTEIIWCKSFGDGWYASGGRFIDILAA